MKTFRKLKSLDTVLISFSCILRYITNATCFFKSKNIKTIHCINSINYDNSLKNILYLELKEVRL
ncbi:hypothetical protein ACNSOO_01315 [Aliarcobacter lanthieri]|uniref:hypothetical protein n=1 Tax=Aliarcobacter lanthieri TaxID=1355374 RepID=UPI0004798824|nr:hypothetical protein [Aliarcobacter lanthieri]QKF58320.1 hypothetical protein ALANTH_0181 [Aliarcobacter lanthieri]